MLQKKIISSLQIRKREKIKNTYLSICLVSFTLSTYVLVLLVRAFFQNRNKSLEGKFTYQTPILRVQIKTVRFRTRLTIFHELEIGNIWKEERNILYFFIFKKRIWLIGNNEREKLKNTVNLSD